MSKRRILTSVMALLLCLFLTACSEFGTGIDDLLTAPKLTGNIYEIQQALESYAVSPIRLKYPKNGDNLSAFNLFDVDKDGVEEAVAFYTYENSTDNTIIMAYIDKSNEQWRVVGSSQVTASDVERLDFADLGGDGKYEILVGWSIFSTLEKTASIYTVGSETLYQQLSEPYNEYIICDLMQAGYPQLLLINVTTAEKTSVAKLYHMDQFGVVGEGSAALDGSVTSYCTPVFSKLSSGKPAVYLDANKGSGAMITEIIYYSPAAERADAVKNAENNQQFEIVQTSTLISPFHDPLTGANDITARPTAVRATDIDSDGVIEMPLMSELAGFSSRTDDEKMYITTWRSYDETRFENELLTIMNYNAGYYFICPAAWQQNNLLPQFTVSRSADYELLSFYEWDSAAQQRGDELFKIQVFTRNEWDNRDSAEGAETYVPISSNKDKVYAVSISDSNSPLSLDESTVKNHFRLIEE